MVFKFDSHTLEETSDGYIVTLYMGNSYLEEFADEIKHNSVPKQSKMLNRSVLAYIKKNLSNYRIYLVKVVAGGVLLLTITMATLEASVIETNAMVKYSQIQISQAVSTTSANIIFNKKILDLPQKPFIIDGISYAPIREVCEALGAEVGWNAENSSVKVRSADKELDFSLGETECYVNGERKTMPQALLVNNKTMVGLRFISETFGFYVDWKDKLKTVLISSDGNFPSEEEVEKLTGDYSNNFIANYTQEDLYWLSRIVNSEASGECYEGKIAVANTVINRVRHESFPNTIKEVIFDRQYAIQYTPTANGEIYKQPSEESINAAKEALNGKDISNGTLYFLNPKKSVSNWIINNRKYAFTIENHDFYY